MNTPTTEKLYELAGQIYGEHNGNFWTVHGPVAEYDALRDSYLKERGEHAPCHEVDPRLWGNYSDLYKDENGHRPRGDAHTYAVVIAWMEARKL